MRKNFLRKDDLLNVDVIIPTHNRAHLLERSLNSVLNQTRPPRDLWVIDDGSQDSTADVIANVQDRIQADLKKTQLHFLRIPPQGVSAARNAGIEASCNDWIAFLDSDDEWLPQKLFLQFELLKKNPDLQMIHGEEIWIRNGVRVNSKKKHAKVGGWIFEHCLPLCRISPSAVLLHRNIFRKMGLFKTSYPVCEDYDYWLRVTSQYPVGFVKEPILKKYGGHDDQLSRRFKAMDYWRVLSLHSVLNEAQLSPLQQSHVAKEILTKSNVLLKGYLKHSNLVHYSEIVEIRNKAEVFLSHLP